MRLEFLRVEAEQVFSYESKLDADQWSLRGTMREMPATALTKFTKRYRTVSEGKSGGATYTPKALADFVARQIGSNLPKRCTPLRVLDPAVGDGELLVSLINELGRTHDVHVHGFDVHPEAIALAGERLVPLLGPERVTLYHQDFLRHVSEQFEKPPTLFTAKPPALFDVVIANPPYVRTQIMGAEQAQVLAERFGLTGRVDLYHAFLVALSHVLDPHGIVGIIVSNRFMTTRAGASVRASLRKEFRLRHVWDLGDTKLFDAAVLPAVLLFDGRGAGIAAPRFTTIYETSRVSSCDVENVLEALDRTGIVSTPDNRTFEVRQGELDVRKPLDDVWALSTAETNAWMKTVEAHTARTFGEVGPIRVGVKTCADSVFIHSDWTALPSKERPELLRPLTTHHIGRRFRAENAYAFILYPHEIRDGSRQPVDLERYPKARAYLEKHKSNLESRKYVLEAGRKWYEIWVPQNPATWQKPKLVFRDIADKPTFWIDLDGTVVNGDCYWMASRQDDLDSLWLSVAVANSTFIEEYYDRRFNNKLYAGRRRFITQYVEKFPLPDVTTKLAKQIIATSRKLYENIDSKKAADQESKLDSLVWRAFGLSIEERSV